MKETVVLVSCVSKKRVGNHLAGELYVSSWFNKAWTYAQSIGDKVYILSAEYGLVSPDALIKSYDKTLNTMSISERRIWAEKVSNSLTEILSGQEKVVFLAGIKYRENIIEKVKSLGCQVEVPMEGLRIGEQMAWLNKNYGKSQ